MFSKSTLNGPVLHDIKDVFAFRRLSCFETEASVETNWSRDRDGIECDKLVAALIPLDTGPIASIMYTLSLDFLW